MAIKTAKFFDTNHVVAILVKNLGTPVAWGPFLGDIRRKDREGVNPPHLHGHQLHPCGNTWPGQRRPMYRPEDVQEFIDLVIAENPGLKLKPATSYTFDDAPVLHWSMRRLVATTTPAPAPTEPSVSTPSPAKEKTAA